MKNFNDCTQAQKIARWENVLRVLQALTPHQRRKHWDMSNWGVKTDCGTVACAAGHCSLDPWFRRRGFKGKLVVVDRWYGSSDEPELRFDDGTLTGRFMGYVIEHFFGPSEDDENNPNQNIFLNEDRRSVGQVIREVKARIKALKVQS